MQREKKKAANKTMILNNVLDNQVPTKSIFVNQGFLLVLLVTGSNIMMCVLIITTCKLNLEKTNTMKHKKRFTNYS